MPTQTSEEALAEDRELARRAAGGDVLAQRYIYDRSSDRLFSLLCYQVGDREDALDLLQETFLRAFSNLDTYRGHAPLEAWLRTIALRRAMDWKRRALRRIQRTAGLHEVSGTKAPELGEADPERDAIGRALKELSANQRAVFLLREWEGRPFEEIGEMLGCKASTVRVHHARARERLRTLLRNMDAQEAGIEGQQA